MFRNLRFPVWAIMRLSVFGLLLATPALAQVQFDPVPVPLHSYSGGWEQFVGGGLAAFDSSGDGLPELFAAGGSAPAALLLNRSGPDGIAFVEATPEALRVTGMTGAYPLDIDNDAHLDLVILRVGENRVLQGSGDCRFAPFSTLDFPTTARWSTAFSATWEGANTRPTLAIGNYVDRTNPNGPFRTCDVSFLHRPVGNDYATTPLSPGFCPLSMLFSDWGRQGRADLRVSNDRHYYVDRGAEQLWAMEDTPRLFTADDGWTKHQLWGMGIASRDLNGDGQPEVYLTSMGDQRLQERAPGPRPTFRDVPFARGSTAHRPYLGGDGRPSTGWHVAFGDVNNDGHDDIFVTKGNVEQMPGSAMDDPNTLLMQGPDGRFTEAGGQAGLASLHRARGAALADFDGDGLLDVAVVNRRAPLEVWRNVTAQTGHWLALSLRQSAPNVFGVGAWIEVETSARTYHREITVGGGHAGGTAGPEHFGLGAQDHARVRVIWPDGVVSGWVKVDSSQHFELLRDGTDLTLNQQPAGH
ncbi:MAG: CRTAC1 family protein [Sedimentitalea sp.]